jgi:hypothetical protein
MEFFRNVPISIGHKCSERRIVTTVFAFIVVPEAYAWTVMYADVAAQMIVTFATEVRFEPCHRRVGNGDHLDGNDVVAFTAIARTTVTIDMATFSAGTFFCIFGIDGFNFLPFTECGGVEHTIGVERFTHGHLSVSSSASGAR